MAPRIHSDVRGLVYLIRSSNKSAGADEVALFSQSGAPSGGTLPDGQELQSTQTAICIRTGSAVATVFYITVNGGDNWTAFDPAALSGFDLNGSEFILDANGNTSLTADTDDQIDIKIGGADDFQFTANIFSVLSGSALHLADSAAVKFGTGQDITMDWDGTQLDVLQAAANSAFRWGTDGAGIDQVHYGDTAGSIMTWDQSADSLLFTDSTPITFGDGGDMSLAFDAADLVITSTVADTGGFNLGVDGAGVDVILFGDTAGSKITWDQSADSLLITDSTPLSFGDGGDVLVQFDATNLAITTAVADTGAVILGASGAGVDLILYGDTATRDITWDQSADSLICNDNVAFAIGTGSDESMAYDGTDFLWTHAGGEWILDVAGVTDSAIVRLGTDTSATDFQVQNDSAAALLTILGTGAASSTEGGIRPNVIADPGAAGAIAVTHTSATCSLTSTGVGAETRTLAIPTFAGQRLSLVQTVLGAGGDVITITVASAVNVTGHLTIAFNAAWDTIDLVAVTVAGTLHWVVVANNGCVVA